MKQTLCYCAYPCTYSETWPKRTCQRPHPPPLPPRCRKVPYNTGTVVLDTVTPDLPDCAIFIVQTGFLYAQVPFKTDVTVVRPQIIEWISIE